MEYCFWENARTLFKAKKRFTHFSRLNISLYILVDMDTLFKESDFVTAHTALTPETAG